METLNTTNPAMLAIQKMRKSPPPVGRGLLPEVLESLPEWAYNAVPDELRDAVKHPELAALNYSNATGAKKVKDLQFKFAKGVTAVQKEAPYALEGITPDQDKLVSLHNGFLNSLPYYALERIEKKQPERVANWVNALVRNILELTPQRKPVAATLANFYVRFCNVLRQSNGYPASVIWERSIMSGEKNALRTTVDQNADFQDSMKELNMERADILSKTREDQVAMLAPVYFHMSSVKGYHPGYWR